MNKNKQTIPKLSISWWLLLLQTILVKFVKVDQDWVNSIRSASELGPVVFVLRNRSLIDFLCLRGLCKRYGLPPITFVSGFTSILYSPLWCWIFLPRGRAQRQARLEQTLAAGNSVIAFLRRPSVRGALDSRPVSEDGIRMVVNAQSALKSSVVAVPTVFLWGEHAMARLPRTMDFLFGSNEYPRLIRSIWLLIRRRSIHKLIACEPMDVAAIRQEKNVNDDTLVGVIKTGVGRHIEQTRRAHLGALTKPSSRVKQEVIGSPRLRTELAAIAKDTNIPADDIEPKTRAIINKMAADIRPRVLVLFSVFMAFVWKRLYTGIEIEEEDVQRIRDAVAKGSTLMLPTHKSHIDYLVISQVMQDHNIMLPHIVAGQNLAFWPMGFIFRSSGAFFIRRSFINDRFYTAILNAYVRRLLQEGYALEVFIEGGRSRTGKLLRPKLGFLEMTLKAMAVTPRIDVHAQPTFIGYEQVIEESSYVKESKGAKKKSESFSGLLGTTKVLFSRYGRLYVRTAESFSISEVMKDLGFERTELEKGSVRREVAFEVAMRNLREINRITVATPSAVLSTVFLASRNDSLELGELFSNAKWLVDMLAHQDAHLSHSLKRWQEDEGNKFFDAALRVFVKIGRITANRKKDPSSFSIAEGQRQPLDYYKNNTIHFLVPASLVCTSCLISDGDVSIDDIVKDVSLTQRLYHWEFMLDAAPSVNDERNKHIAVALVSKNLAMLEKKGILETSAAGKVIIKDRTKALLLADVLRNFHEVYFAAISAAREKVLDKGSGNSSKRATEIAEEMASSGRFIKPEAISKANIKNALDVFKDLKILRPTSDQQPYAPDGLGTRIFNYLDDATKIE